VIASHGERDDAWLRFALAPFSGWQPAFARRARAARTSCDARTSYAPYSQCHSDELSAAVGPPRPAKPAFGGPGARSEASTPAVQRRNVAGQPQRPHNEASAHRVRGSRLAGVALEPTRGRFSATGPAAPLHRGLLRAERSPYRRGRLRLSRSLGDGGCAPRLQASAWATASSGCRSCAISQQCYSRCVARSVSSEPAIGLRRSAQTGDRRSRRLESSCRSLASRTVR